MSLHQEGHISAFLDQMVDHVRYLCGNNSAEPCRIPEKITGDFSWVDDYNKKHSKSYFDSAQYDK